MYVARFWVRESASLVDANGAELKTSAFGWSCTSPEEARSRARLSAERVVRWLADGCPDPGLLTEYQYFAGRPPREEILQEFHDAAGETSATITRNIYGSTVLNCRDLMFIDIDCREPSAPLRWLRKFLRVSRPSAHSEEASLERTRAWSVAHPETALKVYRTAAGLRLVITDRLMRAAEPESRNILAELGSDPLYRRLCDAQECFRARLSPKPWRIRVEMLRVRFPYENATQEAAYRDWQQRYDAAASSFATCQFVEWMGPQNVVASLAPLIELHDSLTGVSRSLPLA